MSKKSKRKIPPRTNGAVKVRKAVKASSIVIKILLVLAGIAIAAFFVWLGVQIGHWAGLIK